ncbi:aKG-HExxH-type peptide beta-hydroxylase [Dactylosporangium salmoneum]|uniref:HEXXH motif domain-containing protein n=1 Tax=Dactylosporangium salmoneum TaxID=53361 RepID=A0ABN3FSX3_9ACTN
MSNERLLLSAEQFAGIAAGYGDAGAMAVLAAGQLAKRKALIAMVLRAARPTRHGAALQPAVALIGRAEDADEAAVAGVLAHPHLDAWATLCLHRLADAERAEAPADPGDDLGFLAAYAVAAAVAAGLTFDIEVPTVDGAATVPGLGRATGLGPGPARFAATASGLRCTGANGVVVDRDGPGWQALRSVDLGGWRLAIEDQDPYRDCYGWRPLPTLADSRAGHLEKLLVDAWQLIEQEHPRHAETLRHSLRCVVPLATPAGGALVSAASRHACGSVGAGVPDTAADLALLLIHEYMHAKLGALLDLCELHTDGREARLHAPWRLDPRPTGALLQGIYAHAGVTDYWRTRRHAPDGDPRRAAAQFAYWRAMNRIAIENLISGGELTDAGMYFATTLRSTLDDWEGEKIAPDIASRAYLFVTAQTVRWLLRNAQADPRESQRLLGHLRFGTPLGSVAERGSVADGAVATPADAPGLLGELHRWLDGRTEPVGPSGPDPSTPGTMLLNGDATGAEAAFLARLDADAADDEAWVGMSVAWALAEGAQDRSDPSGALVHRLLPTRPELVKDVVLELQRDGHPKAATELLKAGWTNQ